MREMSEVLRELAKFRKSSDIPIEEIQELLKQEYDIKAAIKTIYGWESGKVQPPIQTFIALCKIYKVKDIYRLMDDNTDNYLEQTVKEQKLIKNYYKKVEYQEAVDKLLSL